MKKYLSILAFVCLSFFAITSFAAQEGNNPNRAASSEQTVDLYFFWSQDCPHCVAAHPFIDKLKAQYSWLHVHDYDVSSNPRNGRLFEKMARDHGKETSFVPTFFIGDKMIVGYTSAQTTGSEIKEAILAKHK